MNTEKRSSQTETAPSDPGATPGAEGVGGRQGAVSTPSRGGGYLDTCTEKKAPVGGTGADPRIDELRAIGLPRAWIQVADLVGYDLFMGLWKILDNEAPCRPFHIKVPPFSKWQRYQRNRYIIALDSEGLKPREIQTRVRRELRENITLRHIWRIVAEGKIS